MNKKLFKVVFFLVLFCLPSSMLFAQDSDIKAGKFKYDFDGILHYKHPISKSVFQKTSDGMSEGIFKFIAVVAGIKGTVNANLYYALDNNNFVGGILGFGYAYFGDFTEAKVVLLEIPLLLSYRYFSISPYAGGYLNVSLGVLGVSIPTYYSASVGAKLGLGWFLLTFDYQHNFGNDVNEILLLTTGQDALRYGIGFRISFLQDAIEQFFPE